MALIDALPEFKLKPLIFPKSPTRLLPRETEELPEPPAVTAAATTPTVTPSPASYLPDEYGQYEPLMGALNNSEIRNPEARNAILAQMGLERGWKAPSDFNYGNITTGSKWSGAYNERGDSDGKGNKITQKFRSYGSAQEFVDDYLNLLKTNYPKAYGQLTSDGFDIDQFSDGLVGGERKYATDPEYKTKIKNVYNSVRARMTETNE
jgi:hypothetical protein